MRAVVKLMVAGARRGGFCALRRDMRRRRQGAHSHTREPVDCQSIVKRDSENIGLMYISCIVFYGGYGRRKRCVECAVH